MICEISELYNYNISKVLKEDIPSIYDFIVKNDGKVEETYHKIISILKEGVGYEKNM